ncbi:unnamed protein product [Arctogadus glacialis]
MSSTTSNQRTKTAGTTLPSVNQFRVYLPMERTGVWLLLRWPHAAVPARGEGSSRVGFLLDRTALHCCS